MHYVDDLVGGFESIYRLLVRHRDELLAEGGPIAAFADDPIRVLVRPTRSYARLLDESSHPDALRDPADRQELFEALRVSIPMCPVLAHTIDAEQEDLWRGDVPIFTTTPSSTDLVTSTGDVIAAVLNEPGAAAVERQSAVSTRVTGTPAMADSGSCCPPRRRGKSRRSDPACHQ